MRYYAAQILLIAALLACCHIIGERTAAEVSAAPSVRYDLQTCIQTALEKNYDILKSKERIRKEKGVTIEARAQLLPRADITGEFSQIDKDRLSSFNGQTFGTDRNWNLELTVTQVLFAGGKNAALWKRAHLLEQAAVEELHAVINNVLLEVRQRYYAVLVSRSQLSVQEENLKLLEEELKNEQKKLQAGTVSDFNVLRAEVELANSRTPYIRARDNLRLSLEELTRVMGLNPQAQIAPGQRIDAPPIEVTGELKFEPLEVNLGEALKRASENRPELKQLNLAVAAQEQGINAAQAGYLPTVSLFGGYGAEKSRFSDDIGDEVHGWQAGVKTSWNIFDSFRTTAQVSEARSDESLARLNREEQQQVIDIEVRRAYSSWTEAKALVEASNRVVEQAQESLRLARARFDVGSATQLDILDTQVALTQARSNQVQALYDYNVAKAQLEKATGSI